MHVKIYTSREGQGFRNGREEVAGRRPKHIYHSDESDTALTNLHE